MSCVSLIRFNTTLIDVNLICDIYNASVYVLFWDHHEIIYVKSYLILHAPKVYWTEYIEIQGNTLVIHAVMKPIHMYNLSNILVESTNVYGYCLLSCQ